MVIHVIQCIHANIASLSRSRGIHIDSQIDYDVNHWQHSASLNNNIH